MSRFTLLALGVLAVSHAGASAALTFTTSATYDVDSANNVDAYKLAAGDVYSNYTNAFAAAHENNTGGVITFDNYTMTATAVQDTSFNATYGVGVTQTLAASNSGGGTYQIQSASVGTAISGGTFLRVANNKAFSFNFETQLSMVGFTVLSRPGDATNDRVITATVTYSDTTTFVLTDTVSAGGADDTFFGFTAPEGRTITKLLITSSGANNENYFAIDDLGFVAVIPEPSTVGLALLSAAGLVIRRRR